MPNAKKLPSGNWRVQVYSHTDAAGRKHYQSFTAPTKAAAEMEAAAFKNDIDRRRADDITVSEAITSYIDSNDGVLSPSTIRGYRMDLKRVEPIANVKIRKLTSQILQSFITELSKTKSPKTVKNTYGLIASSLAFCGIEKKFKIHLPTIPKKVKNAPENEQIVALYNAASHKMKIAIMLAAFHSLRRGEICGLKYKDLKNGTLHIHSDVVRGSDGWVHKETPKTDASNRIIYLTDPEIKLIGTGEPDSYIVNITPATINKDFATLRKKIGVENLRFHDLRVFFSSVAIAMNIPDIYTSHLGGWREGSSVLKERYQKPIVSINEGYANKMNDYFSKMIDF